LDPSVSAEAQGWEQAARKKEWAVGERVGLAQRKWELDLNGGRQPMKLLSFFIYTLVSFLHFQVKFEFKFQIPPCDNSSPD
jgi:hypothetical protein